MIPGSASPLLLKSAAAAGPVQIERSLRFNSSDSGFCSRTPGTASNRKTWTWAAWVKRTVKNTATDQMLFTGGTTNSDTGFLALDFNSSDKLRLSSAATNFLISTAVYRDPGAWMHIVLAFDATQGTNANKVKLYVNSTEVTVFDTDGRSSISNQDYGVNQAAAHEIGRASLGSNKYLDGYLADVHFIDGQALTPSSFTEVSATTGQLIPKAYAGTYTGNSFWLKFNDNSAATAATLGKDSFLLGNNWTPNNLSVTAGAGNDSLVDTPTSIPATDTGVGGEIRGNYCTLNPLSTTNGTYTQGNLRYEGANSNKRSNGTLAVSTGKWYWEVTLGNAPYAPRAGAPNDTYYNAFGFGISSSFNSTSSYRTSTDSLALGDNGFYKNFTGSETDVGTAFSSGDVLSIAVDLDINTFTFRRNNTQIATGTIGGTAGRELVPIIISYSGQYGVMDCNFGQRAFAYTAPSGFKALCDTNLGAPLVAKPNTLMDVITYTGDGTTPRTISGLAFSPDFVWSKSRNQSYGNNLWDVIRGGGLTLRSDNTGADVANNPHGYLSAFTSTGYTVINGTDPAGNLNTNETNTTYVSWAWDAGTSTDPSNTAGSITSQVRANVSAGFSVVTYTASAGATIGHGLGIAPSLIIAKSRTNGSGTWAVYSSVLGRSQYLLLNATDAAGTLSNYWGTSDPTSTVFGVYSTTAAANNTGDMVAYCFAPVVGYSSFGSYTGNGSTDGPFVYTGFRPRWVLFKNTNSGENWRIMDAARNTYNVANSILYPNLSSSEGSSAVGFDILSNGFKIRETGSELNASGVTIIYAAFAENPFQYARAR